MQFYNWILNYNWKQRVFLHTLYWALYYGFTLLNLTQNTSLTNVALVNLPLVLFDMLVSYFWIWCVDEILLKRKYLLFIVSWLISTAIGVLIRRVILYYGVLGNFLPDLYGFFEFNLIQALTGSFLIPASVLMVAHLIRRGYVYQQKVADLQQEKLNAELSVLKSQVNQHFLFNTLNNIDSLIFTEPEKASDLVIKLSRILRYSIYDSREDLVPLKQEFDYLRDYIMVVSVRMPTDHEIELKLEPVIDDYLITPMLLIPFVENAVKHGDKSASKPSIVVHSKMEEDWLHFEVKNLISSTETKYKGKHGIGLLNVKRRLDIIYPDRYELIAGVQNDNYLVQLKLKLTNGTNQVHSS